MPAESVCQVRRCRHPRSAHASETVRYTRQDGKPGSFEASGRCETEGCTCARFAAVNGLQPTRPCRRCGNEFLVGEGRRLCPECRRTRRTSTPDVLEYIRSERGLTDAG